MHVQRQSVFAESEICPLAPICRRSERLGHNHPGPRYFILLPNLALYPKTELFSTYSVGWLCTTENIQDKTLFHELQKFVMF